MRYIITIFTIGLLGCNVQPELSETSWNYSFGPGNNYREAFVFVGDSVRVVESNHTYQTKQKDTFLLDDVEFMDDSTMRYHESFYRKGPAPKMATLPHLTYAGYSANKKPVYTFTLLPQTDSLYIYNDLERITSLDKFIANSNALNLPQLPAIINLDINATMTVFDSLRYRVLVPNSIHRLLINTRGPKGWFGRGFFRTREIHGFQEEYDTGLISDSIIAPPGIGSIADLLKQDSVLHHHLKYYYGPNPEASFDDLQDWCENNPNFKRLIYTKPDQPAWWYFDFKSRLAKIILEIRNKEALAIHHKPLKELSKANQRILKRKHRMYFIRIKEELIPEEYL